MTEKIPNPMPAPESEEELIHDEFYKELSPEELQEIEELLEAEFPKLQIDLIAHEKQALKDPMLKERLKDMLDHSLEYTRDASRLQKMVRTNPGINNEEIAGVDGARTIAHNAMIASVDAYVRACSEKKVDSEWKYWPDSHRISYGKFAVGLTMNRFKDEVLNENARKTIEEFRALSTKEDYVVMKQNKTSVEIKVIEYVEILTKALEEDRPLTKGEEKELADIMKFTGKKDEKRILAAYMDIYRRDYPQEQD